MISRKGIKLKLDKIVMEIVRERDQMICQWCGKRIEKSNAHCSHVIPRSHGNHLRWDLLNLKLLCFHCHINKWHKNPIEAYEWFSIKFPERFKYLEAKKNVIQKFSLQDLIDLYEGYKNRYQNTDSR